MKNLKQHWYLILLTIFTGALGIMVFLTSQKLKQEGPVAPTVPQEVPEAAQPGACGSFASKSSCESAGCAAGFNCRWDGQEEACKKGTGCATPTPPSHGGGGDFCSSSSCDVGSAFSSSCYVNHYVSKETDDPTVTDLVKSGIAKSSLGYQSCGAEQIDVYCNGEEDSVSRRYNQDCVGNTATPRPPTSTPTPTRRITPTPTRTPTPTSTLTPTPTLVITNTPTPTPPPGSTPTPTQSISPTPTPTTAVTPTPTPSPGPTPNVPISGAGPSVWGALVITGGIMLLLLGLVF